MSGSSVSTRKGGRAPLADEVSARFDAFKTHRDLSKLMHDAVTGESIHIFNARAGCNLPEALWRSGFEQICSIAGGEDYLLLGDPEPQYVQCFLLSCFCPDVLVFAMAAAIAGSMQCSAAWDNIHSLWIMLLGDW